MGNGSEEWKGGIEVRNGWEGGHLPFFLSFPVFTRLSITPLRQLRSRRFSEISFVFRYK